MKTPIATPVRVLTHNIRYATQFPFKGEELWPVRKPRLVNELMFHTTNSPEAFICLQEVLHGQLLDVSCLLNENDGEWQHIGVGRDDGKQAGEYSPIFYRPSVWKLLDFKTIWLSETPRKPSKSWDAASTRILTIGKFQHQQTKMELIAMNTHLDDQGSKSRLEAAKIIANQVHDMSHQDGRADIATFLAGDFNSEIDMEAYRYLADHSPMFNVHDLVPSQLRYGHTNTFTGFGYEALPLTRIDFVFIKLYSKSDQNGIQDPWSVKSYGVLENRFDDGVYNSDHRAVVTDLELRS
ncbi:hypothetical protein MMC34_003325 [Xylographa carneopallida]|nr:hypothetical protein [Xylographa carneopallida]